MVKARDFSEVSISFRCIISVVLIFIGLKRSLIFKEQVSIILLKAGYIKVSLNLRYPDVLSYFLKSCSNQCLLQDFVV